jgi:hypothetical protein
MNRWMASAPATSLTSVGRLRSGRFSSKFGGDVAAPSIAVRPGELTRDGVRAASACATSCLNPGVRRELSLCSPAGTTNTAARMPGSDAKLSMPYIPPSEWPT